MVDIDGCHSGEEGRVLNANVVVEWQESASDSTVTYVTQGKSRDEVDR